MFRDGGDALDFLIAASRRLIDLNDRSAMPAVVRDAIDELTGDDDLGDGTYVAGAAIMLAEAEQRRLVLTFAEAEA